MTGAILWYCTYLSAMCIMALLEANWYGQHKMTILGMLLILDTLTGIYKSYALRSIWEKEYYPSGKVKNKWFNTNVLKVWLLGKLILLIVPLGIIWTSKLIGVNVQEFTAFIVGMIGAGEFISAIQNIIVGRTKKQIQEFDAITFVLQGILWIVKEWIEKRLTTEKFKVDE